jgi:hypothetical protein
MDERKKNSNFPKVFGYAVSIITIIAGIVILADILKFNAVPSVRYTFGIVIVLTGIYRFVITRTKYRTDLIDLTKKVTNGEDE